MKRSDISLLANAIRIAIIADPNNNKNGLIVSSCEMKYDKGSSVTVNNRQLR